LPLAGLLYAIVLVGRTPTDFSAHSHLHDPRHPTRPHR
jgi:hypothetical protein